MTMKNKQLKERLDIIKFRNDPRVKALDKQLKNKPIKPPYNCPSSSNGCIYPSCGCEWYL